MTIIVCLMAFTMTCIQFLFIILPGDIILGNDDM